VRGVQLEESNPILGVEGMQKLEYRGLLNGMWKGAATGHAYRFTRDQPVKWVDKRDAPAFLALRNDGGHPLFGEG